MQDRGCELYRIDGRDGIEETETLLLPEEEDELWFWRPCCVAVASLLGRQGLRESLCQVSQGLRDQVGRFFGAKTTYSWSALGMGTQTRDSVQASGVNPVEGETGAERPLARVSLVW